RDLLYFLLLRRLGRPGEGTGGLRELADVERELVGDTLERFPLQGLVVVRPRPEEERERALERRAAKRVLRGPRGPELQRPTGGEGEGCGSEHARQCDREPEQEVGRHSVVRPRQRGDVVLPD